MLCIRNRRGIGELHESILDYLDGKTMILSLSRYPKKSMTKCRKIHFTKEQRNENK